MKLKRSEELAALKVLQKRIKERVDDLEGALKFDLLQKYGEDGRDRLPLMVEGYEVGTASISKPRLKACIKPGREEEAIKALDSLGLCELQPVKNWEHFFTNVAGKAVHAPTGEMVDALHFDIDRAPYARVTVKDEEVRKAFQAKGIAAEQVLALMEGNDNEF